MLFRSIPVIVDPKGIDWKKYSGAATVKPNIKELGDIIGHEIHNGDKEVLEAGKKVLEQYGIGSLLVTCSEKGMTLLRKDSHVHIPTDAIEVYDVSGAGDTVISTAAICLALGMEPIDIAFLSNLAGGLVCEEVGVVPVNKEKLFAETMARLPDVINPIV